ncbi:MAG: FAD:protein FMN transferase [Taibaiella sp.]|jgi:thiamine biosynthesis lipoprotein
MKKYKACKRLMGSDFELIFCGEEEESNSWLNSGIAEIQRLEYLLTAFSDTSETAKINLNAGIAPVKVETEVWALIQRCIHLSGLTQGAFDITSGALKALYSFKHKTVAWPDKQVLAETLQITGYRHVDLQDNHEVYLKRKGMRIGFGAIGKGYAADCVKKLWMNAGVTSGVVNASGDLTAWGLQPDGSSWKVGIANPDHPQQIIMWLPVNDASVATSGNYEQFFDHRGIRYSHNIDPATGLPARFLKSVTVVSPSAELSDALATAVTIMGVEVGMNFINQLPHVHCVIIDEQNKVFTSEKINTYAP